MAPTATELAVLGALLIGCGGGSSKPVQERACAPAACEQRCEAGDAAACGRAAELFFDGANGQPLDMARSFRHAERGCDGGNLYSCMLLGFHYQDGLGTAWDPARALTTYEAACTAGSGTACYNLGSMYMGGHGIDPDHARGEDYNQRAGKAWEAACRGNERRWCTNAAFFLAGGATAEPSDDTRRVMGVLYQRACDAKVLVGCVEAALVRMQLGELTPEKYLAEQERLCDAGEPTACTAAAFTLVEGKRLAADVPRAMVMFRRGCEAGDKQACFRIGLESGLGERVPRNEDDAARFLGMACDRTHAAACFTLGEVVNGKGDAAAAIGLMRRACQMNHGEACGILALAYQAGRGVTADAAEAARWMRESCRGGFAPACGQLLEQGLDLPLSPELRARMRAGLCKQGLAAACT